MQIAQYDLIFNRMTNDDLELVRGWRNSGRIKQWMIFRENISPESQLEWFKKLDQSSNYYFIASHKQHRIGVMNIKDINWADKSGEPGGFIIEEQYLGTPVPALCLLLLFDFAFNHLHLLTLQGKVLEKNVASLNCNMELGGVLISKEAGVCKVLHTKQNYLNASAKYSAAAQSLYNESNSQLDITD
jgi:RimJ/RimL family protein N-acetyltransferase